MTLREATKFVLEVDPGSDPVTGRVRARDGKIIREFRGWLQATMALEWLAEGDLGDGAQKMRVHPS